MPTIVYTIDLSHLRKSLTGRHAIEGVRDGMLEIAELLVPALRSQMSHPEGPGARSLRFRTDESGGLIGFSITGNDYLRYNLMGTKPHVIEPRNAQALAFTVQGGTLVFAKRVNHPGTQPDRWDQRAWAAIRPSALRALAGAILARMRP